VVVYLRSHHTTVWYLRFHLSFLSDMHTVPTALLAAFFLLLRVLLLRSYLFQAVNNWAVAQFRMYLCLPTPCDCWVSNNVVCFSSGWLLAPILWHIWTKFFWALPTSRHLFSLWFLLQFASKFLSKVCSQDGYFASNSQQDLHAVRMFSSSTLYLEELSWWRKERAGSRWHHQSLSLTHIDL